MEERKISYIDIPLPMINALAEVAMFGNIKYEGRRITDRIFEIGGVELAIKERIDACYRHLNKCREISDEYSFDYNNEDKESDLPHIYHAFYNLGIVITMLEIEKERQE